MTVRFQNLEFDWLGHAGVRIESEKDKIMYLDPWSETFNDKPRDADLVLVTHDDFDHYDPIAIETVSKKSAKIVLYKEIDSSELDFETIFLEYGDREDIAGVSVKAVPAYNLPDGDHVDEDGEPYHDKYEGAGYLLEIDDVTVFFAGDTDFLEIHNDIDPNVLILPIGGFYTMDSEEALEFVKSVKPDLVLPIHYDTFEQIKANEHEFIEKVRELGVSAEIL